MKNIAVKWIGAIVIIMVALAPAKAQNAGFVSKPGTQLTYQVKTATTQYEFTLTLKTWRPVLSFDWVMNGNGNEKGAVNIQNVDAADAMALNNFFTAGVQNLNNQTSIWASSTMYKLLKSNVAANVKFDNATTADELKNIGKGEYKALLNDADTNLPYIKAASNTKELLILDNAQNPLILRMFTETWTVELKSIKQ